MSDAPKIKTDPLYRLLREGKVSAFNEEKARGKRCDLTNCDFRGLDLRGLDTSGLDLSGCYFRQADLRGVDLSKAKLEGASIHSARALRGFIFRAKSLPTRSSCRSCTARACAIAAADFTIRLHSISATPPRAAARAAAAAGHDPRPPPSRTRACAGCRRDSRSCRRGD